MKEIDPFMVEEAQHRAQIFLDRAYADDEPDDERDRNAFILFLQMEKGATILYKVDSIEDRANLVARELKRILGAAHEQNGCQSRY